MAMSESEGACVCLPRRAGLARPVARMSRLAAVVLAGAWLAGCQEFDMLRVAANESQPAQSGETDQAGESSPETMVARLGQLLSGQAFPEPPDNPAALAPLNAAPPLHERYVLAPDDEIEISVYNALGLENKQIIRPDGRIAFPLVGELMAAGKTPDELRQDLMAAFSDRFDQPEVTVIVSGYQGRKFSVSGSVREPGTFVGERSTRVVDAIAMAGGLAPDADLRGASLVRDGQVLPVSLHRLLKQRDLRHNVLVRPRDSIYVPDISNRRILVLGEVTAPSVLTLRDDITLLEAIVRAQGFARGAQTRSVLLVRGSLDDPEVRRVNVQAYLTGTEPIESGATANNLKLESGDIVYVAKTAWATFADFLADIGVSNQLSYIVRQPNSTSNTTVRTVQ